jgi:phospholipase/carboxylesterase
MRPLALALALFACTKQEVPAPREPHRLVLHELVTGGASPEDDLPVIVAIHGLGDSPAGFAPVFDRFTARTRVVIPRAPHPYGGGFAWFAARTQDGDVDRLARELDRATETIERLLAELSAKHGTTPVLTGFSQGGMLSFAIAAKHPERIKAAVPVAGWLPDHLLPKTKPAKPPLVRAMHGTLDPVVPLSLDRQTCERLRALGWDVELLTYEGIDHSVSLEMHRTWMALLSQLAVY